MDWKSLKQSDLKLKQSDETQPNQRGDMIHKGDAGDRLDRTIQQMQ